MQREKRRKQFSEVLTEFMQRAGVSDTELSKRIDVARLTVRRWRQAENLPSEEMILKLKSGLRWGDSAGAVHELTDAEVGRLMIAAGHLDAPLQYAADDEDKVVRTNRCAVYTYKYGFEKFPSRWSSRIIELEQSQDGSIYTMWSGLPSITRPPEFYEGAYQTPGFNCSPHLFDRTKVKDYVAAHKARQEAFERRLRNYEVHHLYTEEGVKSYLNGASPAEQSHFDSYKWQPPNDVLEAQIENILYWLGEHPNFEVRLRPGPVAGNMTVIGHDVVLVEFSRDWQTMPMEAIHGLEIVGANAALQFTRQFRSFWSDPQTLKDRKEVKETLENWREKYIKGDRAAITMGAG